jgi:hypothetical protein
VVAVSAVKGIARLVTASAAAACATVLGTACGGDERSSEPAPPTTTSPPVTSTPVTSTSVTTGEIVVDLAPLGGAGPAGEIRLSSMQGVASQIVVEIEDAEGYVPDVHPGSCLRLGSGPSYFLPPVQAGRSEALLAAPLEKLLDGAHAVHLHAPAGEPVACAELPAG